jgi:hypothetical protein
MFKSIRWYNEALIIVVIIPLLGIVIQEFVPIFFSLIFYFILLIAVTTWRVRKKAISGIEAAIMILLFMGFNFISNIFVPWPLSIVVPISLTFLAIWAIHRWS